MSRRSTSLLLGGALWLLAGDPAAVIASTMAGGPIDFREALNMREQLFVGIVESNPEVDYVPSGCATGLRRQRIGELVVRVTEVLHGSGIRSVEHVREFRVKHVPAGTRVLVGATRTCADEWRLWGQVYYVGEDDMLRIVPPRPAGYSSEEVFVSTGHYGQWVRENGRRPTLTEVRTLPRGVNDHNPSRPFEDIRTLHMVRVTGMTRPAKSTIEFVCDPLTQLLGPMSAGPTRLRFELPPGAGTRFVGAGDTLIVPQSDSTASDLRTYAFGPEYFIVEDGFLPGLGVPVARVEEAFESVGPRRRLRRMR